MSGRVVREHEVLHMHVPFPLILLYELDYHSLKDSICPLNQIRLGLEYRTERAADVMLPNHLVEYVICELYTLI